MLHLLTLLAATAGGTAVAVSKPDLRLQVIPGESSWWKDVRLWLGSGLLLAAGSVQGEARAILGIAGTGILGSLAGTEVVRYKTLKLAQGQLPGGQPMAMLPPGAVPMMGPMGLPQAAMGAEPFLSAPFLPQQPYAYQGGYYEQPQYR